MPAEKQLQALLDAGGPVELDRVEKVARAFLHEAGEYPARFAYLVLDSVVDQEAAEDLLERLRDAHFEGRAKPPLPIDDSSL